MTDVWALLRPLERIETLMAEIYQALAERNSNDDEARRFFGRLALEERRHVTQVQYIRKMARQSRQSFADVQLHLADVCQVLEDLESLHGAVERLSVQEAVTMAISLEQSAAEAHGRRTLAQAGGEVARFLLGLTQGDRSHVDALVNFARARGYPVAPAADAPHPSRPGGESP